MTGPLAFLADVIYDVLLAAVCLTAASYLCWCAARAWRWLKRRPVPPEVLARHPSRVRGLPRDGEPLDEAELEAYAALMWLAAHPTAQEPRRRTRHQKNGS